jgi:hypothetical protein
MKSLLAVAGLFAAGVAFGCPIPSYSAPRASYSPPTVYSYESEVEVEFAVASPVFNKVEVFEVRERRVYVPTIVTGEAIVRREVVEKVEVIRVRKVR